MSGSRITYGTLFAGATTLIAVVAANGQGFADALKAFPEVVKAYSSGLPFGFMSAMLSAAVAVVVWINVRIRVPLRASGADGRSFKADYLAYVAAIAATGVQNLLAGRVDTYGILTSGMIGAMAAAVAVLLARGASALYCSSTGKK